MKYLVLVCFTFLQLLTYAQWQPEETRILNQYIVMLKPGHTVEQLLKDAPDLKIKETLSARMNIWLLERNTTTTPEDYLAKLQSNSNIKLVQFNHLVKERSTIPNDTYFVSQWNMLNTGQNGFLPGADIDATEAWDINHNNLTANGDTIVVAIIDGKFDLAHEDINYFTNYNEVPGNGIDDDGNGYIDDVNGWNAFDDNGDINSTGSSAYHSTHLAGIAGAIGNNGKGVAGVCWGVKILPVNYGSATESNVMKSYNYVREMRILYDNTFGTKGAFVVSTNSSFGQDKEHPADYPIWCALYDSLGAQGILSAAATANGSWDVDVEGDIPTECPSKWLISVTNTNTQDRRNSGSAWGKVSIDLGAPGTNIYSTIPSNNYSTMTGTSMSTPHVAGAIAALYATACKGLIDAYYQKPDSIALLIKEYLLNGTTWIPAMNNITTTGGRLNLLHAMQNLSNFNCDTCSFSAALQKTNISCYGINSGMLQATVQGSSTYSYNWSNGSTATTVTSLAPGYYMLTVTDDSTGCSRILTESIHYPDSIALQSPHIIPTDGITPGTITLVATAGYDTLLYSIDGFSYQATPIFSIGSNGSYTGYIKNTEGCVIQQSITVNAIDDPDAPDFNILLHPNPAGEILNVSFTLKKSTTLTTTVTNTLGQVVYQSKNNFNSGALNYSINTSKYANGLYYLNITSGKTVRSQKFMVSK